MFLIANLIKGVATIFKMGLTVYFWIIIFRALISWVNPDPYNPIVQFLYRATEPVLLEVRKRMPQTGGIDLSPIVVLLAIVVLHIVLVESLLDLSHWLRSGQSSSMPF